MLQIELRGMNFQNKGAQLMLVAILQHYSVANHSLELCANLRTGNFLDRAAYRIKHLLSIESYKYASISSLMTSLLNTGSALLPEAVRQYLGLVRTSDVDAVLDASGFALSEQWGPKPAMDLAARVIQWKREGKKIILLPQAFGPFESKQSKAAISKIIAHCDLIFARDQVSFSHLLALAEEVNNIKLAPDFTNIVPGSTAEVLATKLNAACIIPNYRMLDKTTAEISGKYLPFLLKVYNQLVENGLEPFLLINETKDDYWVAKEIQAQVGKEINIVEEADPVITKGLLGQCILVVGSRYHGLVSALSQGVPCLGTGWSHKYKALFNDYRCPDLLVSPLDSSDLIHSRLNSIISNPSRDKVLAAISEAGMHMKQKTHEMWAAVDAVLGF
jgi:colanic acid/amylovoran biosynthesis protein